MQCLFFFQNKQTFFFYSIFYIFFLIENRKLRFERVLRELKVTRIFSTILEELRAIGVTKNESRCTDVMVPAAHSDRSPVLLLMGGGMGAGKSTVLKQILKEYVHHIFFLSSFFFLLPFTWLQFLYDKKLIKRNWFTVRSGRRQVQMQWWWRPMRLKRQMSFTGLSVLEATIMTCSRLLNWYYSF